MTPQQAHALINDPIVGPAFRAMLRAGIRLVTEIAPLIEGQPDRWMHRHHIRAQYRHKSRGHR